MAAVWSFKNKIAKNTSFWQGDIEADPALRERVIHAAERAHAHHFIQDLPNEYQTQVGGAGCGSPTCSAGSSATKYSLGCSSACSWRSLKLLGRFAPSAL